MARKLILFLRAASRDFGQAARGPGLRGLAGRWAGGARARARRAQRLGRTAGELAGWDAPPPRPPPSRSSGVCAAARLPIDRGVTVGVQGGPADIMASFAEGCEACPPHEEAKSGKDASLQVESEKVHWFTCSV